MRSSYIYYRLLLSLRYGSAAGHVRTELQDVLIDLREKASIETGMDSQDTQDFFESLALRTDRFNGGVAFPERTVQEYIERERERIERSNA